MSFDYNSDRNKTYVNKENIINQKYLYEEQSGWKKQKALKVYIHQMINYHI